jgi:hypothetical protein
MAEASINHGAGQEQVGINIFVLPVVLSNGGESQWINTDGGLVNSAE